MFDIPVIIYDQTDVDQFLNYWDDSKKKFYLEKSILFFYTENVVFNLKLSLNEIIVDTKKAPHDTLRITYFARG